ncbi:putative bifunctional diguanylate cyclase/phosphodiesterase [Deinococcus hohokamensis]|uniref:Bifunctional diguanylate cyclase/phosphodiesterase n=1 Tax=Deinococcus hohokamensis TaxID=309883 RepID=A0ABV9IA45_9DEIO
MSAPHDPASLTALLDEAEALRGLVPQRAYRLAQDVLGQAEAASPAAARALFLMGIARYEEKRPAEALEVLERAAACAAVLGDAALETRVRNGMALAHTDLGDFGRAVALHLSNLERSRLGGDLPGQLRSLINLSTLHTHTAEREAATRYAGDAAALAARDGLPEFEVQARHALGYVHARAGQHEAARAAFEEALTQVRAQGLRPFEAMMVGGLFGALSALGRHQEVLAREEELRALVTADSPVLARVNLHLHLGTAHAVAGQPETAEALLQGALHLTRGAELRREAAEAHAALAQLRRRQGRWPEALSELEQARALDRTLLDAAGEQRSQLLSAQLAAELERVRAEELQAAQAELTYRATHDPLTGLGNRARLEARLDTLLGSGASFGLMFTDVNDFKHINDTLGHGVGDDLLCQVAGRLRAAVGEDAIRFGGDEFIVVFPVVRDAGDLLAQAQAVLAVLRPPFELPGRGHDLGAAGGLVWAPADGTDPSTLLRRADAAMYVAKRTRTPLVAYRESIEAAVVARLDLDQALRQALDGNEFFLVYQPICDLASGAPTGVETLVRWRRPGHGVIGPSDFIGAAEDNGLILPLGTRVLRGACRQVQRWQQAGVPVRSVAVNVSPLQLADPVFPQVVQEALREFGVAAGALTLEVTERVAVEDLYDAGRRLSSLRALGVRVALDDFGTGQSSLAVLRRLPIDVLKLDQTFVRDAPTDESARAVLAALLALSTGLELSAVAEGVETEAHRQTLMALGSQTGQGYTFAPPLTPEDLPPWWARQGGRGLLPGAQRRSSG